MRVAILEWICSSYRGFPHEEHLLNDGRAMLGTLLKASILAGNEAATLVSDRLTFSAANSMQAATWSACRIQTTNIDDLPPDAFEAAMISKWQQFASDHDRAIIVAPEIDGLLERVVAAVSETCEVLNCTGEAMVVCSDKLALSKHLDSSPLHHPKTWLASQFAPLDHPDFQAGQPYVFKPRRGAGCHQVRFFKADDWGNLIRDFSAASSTTLDACLDNFIVQELVQGDAYSQSALVGTADDARPENTIELLQPCKQQLTPIGDGGVELSSVTVANEVPSVEDLELSMRALLKCLPKGLAGWIGVDLVYSQARGRWFVIEVNPRCTASIECLWESTPKQVAKLFCRTSESL